MTTPNNTKGKSILERIARRVMVEHGFQTDFSPSALADLQRFRMAVAHQVLQSKTCDNCSGHRLIMIIPWTWTS